LSCAHFRSPAYCGVCIAENRPCASEFGCRRVLLRLSYWLLAGGASCSGRPWATEETLAARRANLDACSPAARRLLQLVELGRQRAGRARLGEINRAVNLSIKATSDLSQYGVEDFWSAPLATIENQATISRLSAA
jgi:predicted transglutaminase-like cysteine proteinase